MNIAMKSVLGIVPSIALLLNIGCEPDLPRYGVASFGYWSPHVLAECPGTIARNTRKRRGEQYALVHFRSPPGKFTITSFILVSPEGVEHSPSCFRNPPVRNWDQVIRFTRDGPTTTVINTVRGDLDLYLLYAIEGQPSQDWKLKHLGTNNKDDVHYEISNSALVKEDG